MNEEQNLNQNNTLEEIDSYKKSPLEFVQSSYLNSTKEKMFHIAGKYLMFTLSVLFILYGFAVVIHDAKFLVTLLVHVSLVMVLVAGVLAVIEAIRTYLDCYKAYKASCKNIHEFYCGKDTVGHFGNMVITRQIKINEEIK